MDTAAHPPSAKIFGFPDFTHCSATDGNMKGDSVNLIKWFPGTMGIHQHSGILIVDDSATVRGVVKRILVQLGYQNIDEASDGATALKKISEKHFSLVISDWNMEPMTGFQLLEEIRSNKTYANLCFIMMTADHAINKVVSARHARVDCFINKPFRTEELQAKILQANAERQPTTAG